MSIVIISLGVKILVFERVEVVKGAEISPRDLAGTNVISLHILLFGIITALISLGNSKVFTSNLPRRTYYIIRRCSPPRGSYSSV